MQKQVDAINALSKMNVGKILKCKTMLFEHNAFFYSSYKDVFEDFLRICADINDFSIGDTPAFRETYLSIIADKECPSDSDEFYIHLCGRYLFIQDLPINFVANLYVDAARDLKSITKTLSKLKAMKDALEKKKKDAGIILDPIERYRFNMISYYENKNLRAQQQIYEYLENGIQEEAIASCSTFAQRKTSIFGAKKPYHYRNRSTWWFDGYDIENSNEYEIKFLDLAPSELRTALKNFKTDPSQILPFSKEYIQTHSVIQQIRDSIKQSHYLADRKSSLNLLIDSFERQNYIAFNHIVPLQIEGIFNDSCIAIGTAEKDLEMSSLNDKLNILNAALPAFWQYEYFAFYFPVIRNKVAHGKVLDGDHEYLAHMLVLDLLPACKFIASNSMPIVKNVELIRDSISMELSEKYVFIVDNVELLQSDIPDYYELKDGIAEMRGLYETEHFWESVQERYAKMEPFEMKKAYRNIAKIKVDEKSKKYRIDFFKSLKKPNIDPENAS